MKKCLLLIACCLPFTLLAQAPTNPITNRDYKVALGVLGTYQAVGLQTELRFSDQFAFKAVGALSFDKGRRAGENSGAGIGLLTYYIPTNHPFIEPLVGLGGIYSWYHWELYGTSGTIHDVNVGGGLGTNLRFSNHFRTGFNVFLGNGFRAEYQGDKMSTVSRRLLILPTLTLDFLL
ncbi:hypothetical protein SAMN00120144_3328 [Hymenobacter roseosalivarius DSM 11622]|uniref:Outer membrane protein beta-barrel domain-containing protein n=1 Tax=Hymenobacter roseosalivarius DSM 11622 TaxID=645990 RepID=A0A1W1VHW0_9BACT|nr:hypothetical protein [Hymenobacter roseosalivarius]SMB92959.1 hypothetical protein SAMN00120144_3328 [Hymenobacter roseosalivarius DSM 11622]